MAVTTRRIECPEPVDVALTFGGPLTSGPSAHIAGDTWWRAMNSPEGPVTVRVRVDRAGGAVEVAADGPGRDWAIEHAGGISGTQDDPSEFFTTDEYIASLQHRLRGMRVVRLGCALDLTASTIFEQRVTTVEAKRAWRTLVRRHGTPAPGCVNLVVPPSAATWSTLADREWRRVGIEQRRSSTVRTLARESTRVDHAADRGAHALDQRLRLLRGIGPWTAATVAHYVAGDTDAVPVGDWHLPGHVGYALTGERGADDARMLELLEPFRPHRARVWRLIVSGTSGPPRRAPRAPILGLLRAEAARR